jgi:hypothetical protein
MQYAYIFIAVITLFWDKISTLFASKEAKILVLAVVFYYIYSRQKKKEDNEKLLTDFTKEDNEAGIWAVDIWNALHPILKFKIASWVPILGGYFDDGTDEETVKRVATECGQKKSITALVEAYKSLYGDDLMVELKNDDVLDIFKNAYNGIDTTDTSGTKTNTTTGTNTTKYIKSGNSYKVKGGWNLRAFDGVGNPTGTKTVENQTWNVFEIWTKKTLGTGNNKVTDTFIRARKSGDVWIKDYWIALGAFKP